MASDYNPSDHTVEEVNAYLADNPDQRDAVLAAERDGKNRTSLTGDSADDGDTGPTKADVAAAQNDGNVGTGNTAFGTPVGLSEADGTSLADAQRKASEGTGETTASTYEEALEVGRFGTSPQAEALGLADKGLSQETPEVMNPTPGA